MCTHDTKKDFMFIDMLRFIVENTCHGDMNTKKVFWAMPYKYAEKCSLKL